VKFVVWPNVTLGLAMLPIVRNKLPAKGNLCVKRHVAISSEQAVSALDSQRSKVHVSHHTTPYDKILEPDIRASTQCAMAIVMFLRPLQMHLTLMRKNKIKPRRLTLLRIH
jgi:hypothetical protein